MILYHLRYILRYLAHGELCTPPKIQYNIELTEVERGDKRMADEIGAVLVITAHPDDADFGCSGSVAKWVSEGRDVVYVLCTSGDKGSDDPNMTSERLAAIREQEQRNAGAALGLKDVVFLRYPDGGVEDTYEFRSQLVRLIRRFRPAIVVTQDPFRWQHRDHRTVGRVT
ncbi:MAG: family deacetylase, partial [Dehalococcoidia bacterium]|nr:family deacetylase [Dehalococcoidia bacterium]